jgi:hypothetical protein
LNLGYTGFFPQSDSQSFIPLNQIDKNNPPNGLDYLFVSPKLLADFNSSFTIDYSLQTIAK